MQTILLLHGAMGSSTQLEPLGAALGQKGNAVYHFNFSGHGGEPFSAQFGIEQFALEARNFTITNKLSNLTIFGYSMGGYAALWLAYLHPPLIQKIVTLGTKFDWSPALAAQVIQKMNPEKIEQKVPAFAQALQKLHAPTHWKQLMYKTVEMMKQLGDSPLLSESILSQIKTPTTIALGDADDMADRVYSQKVSTVLPNARFVLLPETPHAIEKVSAERIVELIV